MKVKLILTDKQLNTIEYALVILAADHPDDIPSDKKILREIKSVNRAIDRASGVGLGRDKKEVRIVEMKAKNRKAEVGDTFKPSLLRSSLVQGKINNFISEGYEVVIIYPNGALEVFPTSWLKYSKLKRCWYVPRELKGGHDAEPKS